MHTEIRRRCSTALAVVCLLAGLLLGMVACDDGSSEDSDVANDTMLASPDADTAESWPPPPTGPCQTPRHSLLSWVRIEALKPDRYVDSVRLVLQNDEGCGDFYADTIEATTRGELLDYEAVLDPPDGVSDDGSTCDVSLGARLEQVGDIVVVGVPYMMRVGDVIEVRDAAACTDDEPGPALRISVPRDKTLDAPHVVLDEVGAPISRVEVTDAIQALF